MVIYEINETKRTVVARYQGNTEEVKTSLKNTLLKFVDYDAKVSFAFDIHSILEKYEYRFNMIGKAVCHEDDVFDVEKGKKIALNRLNRKFAVLRQDIIRDTLNRLINSYIHTKKMMLSKLK